MASFNIPAIFDFGIAVIERSLTVPCRSVAFFAELHIDQQHLRWSSCALRSATSSTTAVSLIVVWFINPGSECFIVLKCVGHCPIIFPAAIAASGSKRPAQVTLSGQTFLPALPAVLASRFIYGKANAGCHFELSR
jgi:hypothetical protein